MRPSMALRTDAFLNTHTYRWQTTAASRYRFDPVARLESSVVRLALHLHTRIGVGRSPAGIRTFANRARNAGMALQAAGFT